MSTGFALPAAETGLRRGSDSLEVPEPLTPGQAHYYAAELADIPASANQFELQVSGGGALRHQGSLPPQRFALYADAHGFCPEVFIRVNLEPGETVRWSSAYHFDLEQSPTSLD